MQREPGPAHDLSQLEIERETPARYAHGRNWPATRGMAVGTMIAWIVSRRATHACATEFPPTGFNSTNSVPRRHVRNPLLTQHGRYCDIARIRRGDIWTAERGPIIARAAMRTFRRAQILATGNAA